MQFIERETELKDLVTYDKTTGYEQSFHKCDKN